MRIDRVARRTIAICAGMIILSGCGGSQATTLPSATADQTGARSSHASRSWIDPSASGQNLLYISSNDRGNVYTYTYPQGKLIGTLTGFISPFGECSDAAGDVFIVAYSTPSMTSSTIYEYAHGGTSPIAMLNDPNVAFGCAVDPSTGNLAASGAGIAIFTHATGTPKLYFSSVPFYYCGYDLHGNLFLTGINGQSGNANLYELANGSSKLKQISLDTTLYIGSQAPSVQWSERHLTVSSNPWRKPITVYRLHIAGGTAKVIGRTTLTSRLNYYFGQTWIQGKTIIGFGLFKRGYQNAYFWPFPKGGNPHSSIRKVAQIKQELSGATVSLAPSR